MPTLPEIDQAAILLQVGLGSPGPAFYANKALITISRQTFKKHFVASDFLEQSKKHNREHPLMDGYHIFEKKKSGKYKVDLMDRGQPYETLEFENKDALVTFLVDRIYVNLGL